MVSPKKRSPSMVRTTSGKKVAIKKRSTSGVKGDFLRRKLQGKLPQAMGPNVSDLASALLKYYKKTNDPKIAKRLMDLLVTNTLNRVQVTRWLIKNDVTDINEIKKLLSFTDKE